MKTRLQKFLADCGVASRRESENLIREGRVRVNGEVRTDMPVMIDPEKDMVTVDEQVVETEGPLKEEAKVYYLLNKPKGILVTNYDPSDRKTVGELMEGVKERVFPVGRLDMDSRGALIMTNDGELANLLTHPRYGVEKTYIVEVEGKLSPAGVEKIKKGLWLGPERGAGPGERTERFKVKIVGRERGRTLLEVKISEGKNREIRRVMARVGHTVRDLNRVAIAGKVTTHGVKVGEYRKLTAEEVKWLYYASSREYQDKVRQSTQQWYEEKEMVKERKRLAREAADEAAGVRKPAPAKAERKAKEKKERPARKGKKPFVPPSGRNAGKLLGGDRLGRRSLEKSLEKGGMAMEKDLEQALQEPGAPRPEDRETFLRNQVRNRHPLGDMARDEE